MEYVLIGVGILTGALIWVLAKSRKGEEPPAEGGAPADDAEPRRAHAPAATCCGAHEVCEAETLLTLTDEVIYYDDEELDRYRGTAADDYSDGEIDEFREVLLTLQPHEVAGWLRSLGLRGVEPPAEIRDEGLTIVGEFRDERRAAAAK